jgi:penicillin-binding protein 1C
MIYWSSITSLLKANDINNIAAIVLDVETGATLAYAGNITHHEDPQMESDVDVIDAPRSPGSTLKPLLYASMLHDG